MCPIASGVPKVFWDILRIPIAICAKRRYNKYMSNTQTTAAAAYWQGVQAYRANKDQYSFRNSPHVDSFRRGWNDAKKSGPMDLTAISKSL